MKTLLFIILLGLAAYFVWPTRYAEYAPGEGPHAAEVNTSTRVDRFTGEVEAQTASGVWQPIGHVRKATAFEQPAVDPNATRRPSAIHHQEVRDTQLHSVERTQKAVDAATQQNP